MRVLVTGAAGQLGGDLLDRLSDAGHDAVGHVRADGDLAAPGVAAAAVARVRPDAVVNCAAWTRVDQAEAEPDAARSANAVLPRLLAEACAAAGARLCHVSTDFVFDGSATAPIPEDAPVAPINVYGRTKLEGEQAVARVLPGAQIVRTAWLYGRSGPNFLLTMLRLANEGRPLRVVDDQRGSPTWTADVAGALVRLVERGDPGTFHIVNSGDATWHDVAVATLEAAGRGDVVVERIGTAEYPTPARRPRYSVLDTRAWRRLGEAPLRDWRSALRDYVTSLDILAR